MRPFFSIFAIWLSIATSISSQQKIPVNYSKVKILLDGKNIDQLSALGIETDHGIYIKDRFLINDFSDDDLKLIRSSGFITEILIEDVSSYYADASRPSELRSAAELRNSNCNGTETGTYVYKTPSQYQSGKMGGYFTFQEMTDILDTMAARYPHLISIKKEIEGYTTYNGNKIFYVKVSDNVETDEDHEPEILYTALHHAREPNSLSQMIFYLWYILENYGKDALIDRLVNNTQMYFIPCVNPDGYLLNQTNRPNGGGLWRKNSWKDSLENIKGVDLNRNYGYFWGFDNIGSSNNPDSQTYRGMGPSSEPETRAVQSFCIQHDFKIALNYHTYGNYLIHPWGYNDKPTNEDILFKALGRVINRENNFQMGTGTETVGYTTNGDSDDWMYGEKGEKSSIYSFTPEVGPSFWPAASDIDYLNKSCMWMNMATALLTLSYYDAKESNNGNFLSPEQNKIYVHVSRAGLQDGVATVMLTSLTDGITVLDGRRLVSLPLSGSDILVFELDIELQKNYAEGILFKLDVVNEGIVKSTEISKKWLNKAPITLYYDACNNFQRFKNEGWYVTDKSFISSPSAIKSSESDTYPSNYKASVTLKDPIDMSNVSAAILNFYARWDIEDNYDYVQILASKDNRDFIPLCGKYSNTGTIDQSFNSPLYDGTVNDWVHEEIDLTDFVGQPKVWIKFSIVTDGLVEREGFYFDDLEIKAIAGTTSVPEDKNVPKGIFPGLISGHTLCHIQGILPDAGTQIVISDVTGLPVLNFYPKATSFEINAQSWPEGIYFYSIIEDGIIKANGKLVVIH